MGQLRLKVAPVWRGAFVKGEEYDVSDEVSFLPDNPLAQQEDYVEALKNGNLKYGHYRSMKRGNNQSLTDRSAWKLVLDLSGVNAAMEEIKGEHINIKRDEGLREEAESSRRDYEAERNVAESGRREAEKSRVIAEDSRKTAEDSRETAEESRNTAEESRETAEDSRKTAEDSRETAEESRNTAEESRETAEDSRKTAEDSRETAETGRYNAELLREAQEKRREENEGIRGKVFDESQRERANAFTTAQNNREEAFNAAEAGRDAKIDAKVEDITRLQEDVDYLKDIEYYYGVEFDTTIPSPECTRIGRMELHRRLPIHNAMRGCLLDDDGNVVKYLNSNDWTNEVLDGSQGQVMVEIPQHYRKFETEGTKRRVLLSELPLAGYHVVPKSYVSAYQATMDRDENKLASVKNTQNRYRGGTNNADFDNKESTLLGKPATGISRTDFREYARNRKPATAEWNCMTYDLQKTLYWLFVVEYATLNSQAEFNAQLSSAGFRQGGLGKGVTTLNGTLWNNFNAYNPVIPCGVSDELGNKTGVYIYRMPESYDTSNLVEVQVPRYRGIENPFGHIYQWTDGINIRISANAENGGDGLSKIFVASDPAKFSDTGYTGYSHVGNEARSEGYAKELVFGEYGEIMPAVVGGGTTTYHCDYHYTSIPESGESLRGVSFGGGSADGAGAGFVYADSYNVPSAANAFLGSRLCFIPAR